MNIIFFFIKRVVIFFFFNNDMTAQKNIYLFLLHYNYLGQKKSPLIKCSSSVQTPIILPNYYSIGYFK